MIELLIAIAVLAIVVAIAVPSYRQFVLKSGRAEAQSTLYQTAQALERCYTRFSVFNDPSCPIVDGQTIDSENDKYTVSVSTTATGFDLTATPNGGQADDSDCPSFGLDATGTRFVNGGTNPADIAECWR